MPPAAKKKPRAVFVCQACGHQSPKWMGRCSACQAWSSLVEEIASSPNPTGVPSAPRVRAVALADITGAQESRDSTGIPELDRVLGGGLVQGSLVLVGGDPGIGKSTLILQVVGALAGRSRRVLYVTGEESLAQVKMRAERLGVKGGGLYLLAATDLGNIDDAIADIKPDVLVLDSVQTVRDDNLSSAPGSVAQIRQVTQRLVEIAKGQNIATFVIGHVTKEGAIAGPKVMEHMVDTVLYFEGERTGPYRLLRSHKNRFGSAQEMGVFEMCADGLHAVSNPSALFLAQRAQGPGATVVTSLEGSRPILLEVQALVTPAFFGGTPRRNTTGFDPMRVAMLCAVLGARCGLDLGGSDVFVNMAGGVRVSEPAADLGVLLALASAAANRPLPQDWVVVGEVGLSGEVRAANQLGLRLVEAASLGFKEALVPAVDVEAVKKDRDIAKLPIAVRGVRDVGGALTACGIELRPIKRAGGAA